MIRVEQLCVRAGTFRLGAVSFELPAGSYTVLMGRTGCGKTTLLEALCGLRRVESGRVWVDGEEVTHWDPAGRGIGYVPQDRALFQTMTVEENLAFGLTVRGVAAAERRARVQHLAELLGITHLLERRPAGLSGGEAQRVALGRALAIAPRILCLDEPLSALDEETRGEMYALLKAVRAQTGVTTLHVTHHPEDARQLADQVFRLENGKMTQVTL
ncbi:MAG: ABC transporter ATP-binding protein [Verrucomicrobiae bacterium]|nr:ABC transporter ATP-binding protein [Verrucomicrobiae bacterium]